MCRETVAAPPSLQDIVYPILSEKSLHFCEKTSRNELFTKFPNDKNQTARCTKILVFQNDINCQFHYSRQGRRCQLKCRLFGGKTKKYGKKL